MVDPANVTNYRMSQYELEEFALFSIVVAGKTASTQARLLQDFLNDIPALFLGEISPFAKIRYMINGGILRDKLEKSKLGQYTKIYKAFREIVMLPIDLRTCTVEELEAIHGIGPKTARFFILHSRPNQKVAALDTHILRYMREELGIPTPKSTPSGKKYAELEQLFIKHAEDLGRDTAELDLEIWNRYSKGGNNAQ